MKKILIVLLSFVIINSSTYASKIKSDYKQIEIKLHRDSIPIGGKEKIIPLYAELKYSFKRHERINPFLKVDLGVNYVETEEEMTAGDLAQNDFSGVGIGVDVGYLTMELDYLNYHVVYQTTNTELFENRIQLKLKYAY